MQVVQGINARQPASEEYAPKRVFNTSANKMAPQAPAHQPLPLNLAWPGKSQVKFGIIDAKRNEVFSFLDRKFINQRNEMLTAGDVLLDLVNKSKACDGDRGPRSYLLNGKPSYSRYLYVMDKDLGFTETQNRDTLMSNFIDLGLFEDLDAKAAILAADPRGYWKRSAQPAVAQNFGNRLKLSLAGREVAMAWEARDAEHMYGSRSEDPRKAKAMQVLNRTYTTASGESIPAGKILQQLVQQSRECDGKPSPTATSYEGRPVESRYFYVLQKDVGIEDEITGYQIMNAFWRLKLLTPEADADQPNSRMTQYGRVALQTWNAEHQPQAVNKTLLDDKVDWLSPPVDLTKMPTKDILQVAKFPPEVLSKVQEKLQQGKNPTESSKAASWLNVTFRLPWVNETRDKSDVKAAREILDRDFYGMESLKNRLLEEISIRKSKGGNKGGIILLVGPPGTGKTAVARTLAEALGRKFVLRSLSGISDAHKITGHDYTYVGAEQGMIIDGLMEAGSKNPVFQIDELDKVGQHSSQGNPLDALLPVLDPQQNNKFTDSFLKYPVDLSKVLFVCTANRIEDFPAHLLSRTEVIHFDSYLPEEKVKIAQKHLIAKQFKEYNMPEDKVRFTPESLEHLINYYTLEGGVRKLEGRIKDVIRKASLYFEFNPEVKTVHLTPELIDSWLPNKISKESMASHESRIGMVNGMYYSEAGGGVLPVQVSASAGTGRLILTGRLGDVMKEAAQVALSFIKENASQLEIDETTRKRMEDGRMDIHIHYPDGATPKDGPSAGTSTFLALWSQLAQKPIPADLSLTGEIDLKGNAGRIGGILEKVSGAQAQGIHTVFLPRGNQKDFNDICNRSEIFRRIVAPMDIQFVSNVLELVEKVKQKTSVSKAPEAK